MGQTPVQPKYILSHDRKKLINTIDKTEETITDGYECGNDLNVCFHKEINMRAPDSCNNNRHYYTSKFPIKMYKATQLVSGERSVTELVIPKETFMHITNGKTRINEALVTDQRACTDDRICDETMSINNSDKYSIGDIVRSVNFSTTECTNGSGIHDIYFSKFCATSHTS
jgi:hypothetical protein